MARPAPLLLLALALGAVPAAAGQARSLSVSAADLDLSSPAGRATLDARVAGAVREVCTVRDWGAGLDAQRQGEACSHSALAATTPQVEALVRAARSRRLANASITVAPR